MIHTCGFSGIILFTDENNGAALSAAPFMSEI